MSIVIDTVFANGVFRPVQPVSLPENHAVRIHLENSLLEQATPVPPCKPTEEIADEYSEILESDLEYVSVPPKARKIITARVVSVRRGVPMPYPDEN